MDFAVVEPDAKAQEVRAAIAALLDETLGDIEAWPVHSPFHWPEQLYTALGAHGLLFPRWPTSEGGAGVDALGERVIREELMRRQVNLGRETPMVAQVVRKHGSDEIRAELLREVAAGTTRFCLGYSEPDGGSDLANVKTRAAWDGQGWIINGTKVFTSAADFSQYVFLLTCTDPDAPRHRGLTMFLVPLDSPGIEIQPLITFGGDRTNITYYSDVRVPDKYRLGGVNEGWRVLHDPLDTEHGFDDVDEAHLEDVNGQGSAWLASWTVLLARVLRWSSRAGTDGRAPIDDPVIATAIAEVAVDLEIARNTPGAMGKVATTDGLLRSTSRLLELVGPAGIVREEDGDNDDSVERGFFDACYRRAQVGAIAGGSVEVFKNILAVSLLGLPRPLPTEARVWP